METLTVVADDVIRIIFLFDFNQGRCLNEFVFKQYSLEGFIMTSENIVLLYSLFSVSIWSICPKKIRQCGYSL